MITLEQIPADEPANIARTAELTVLQLNQRYVPPQPVLRGVHAKDHGCVTATFKVRDDVPKDLQVGVLADAGRAYEALIRFSNAAVRVEPDSTLGPGGLPIHGSRGMAIKLLGVNGTPLLPTEGPFTQDFVMINEPVFAFANVEDYLALSEILLRDKDNAAAFFARTKLADAGGKPTPAAQRAARTLGIINRIHSNALTDNPAAYQAPPASPLDNRYFSASPFLFGEGRVMKFSAKPLAPVVGEVLDVSDPHYLRTALHKRLTTPEAVDVLFTFLVQIRTAEELADKIETDIEDASFEWDADKYPFVEVATVTIPPQDFDTDERRAFCESLTYSPWHGLTEHRPLGGINRLRRPVYEASSHRRLGTVGSGGCPMSGIS